MYVSNREQAVQKRIFCELKLAEKTIAFVPFVLGSHPKKLTFIVYIKNKNLHSVYTFPLRMYFF